MSIVMPGIIMGIIGNITPTMSMAQDAAMSCGVVSGSQYPKEVIWRDGGGGGDQLKRLHPLPQGFEIAIAQGHLLDRFNIPGRLHCLVKPFPSFLQPAELGGVTGKVVGNDRFLGKFFEGGKERLPGALEAAAVLLSFEHRLIPPTAGRCRANGSD